MCKHEIFTVKSREEIENSLLILEESNGTVYANYNGKTIDFSTYLWDICGKTIDASNISRFSTGFDYMYVHQTTVDGCIMCPIIYLMKDWLSPVAKQKQVENVFVADNSNTLERVTLRKDMVAKRTSAPAKFVPTERFN